MAVAAMLSQMSHDKIPYKPIEFELSVEPMTGSSGEYTFQITKITMAELFEFIQLASNKFKKVKISIETIDDDIHEFHLAISNNIKVFGAINGH